MPAGEVCASGRMAVTIGDGISDVLVIGPGSAVAAVGACCWPDSSLLTALPSVGVSEERREGFTTLAVADTAGAALPPSATGFSSKISS
jgi:hypothetical protein